MLLWKVKKNTFKFAVCAKIQKITRRVTKETNPLLAFRFSCSWLRNCPQNFALTL